MSSILLETRLVPDPLVRRLVQFAGCALLIIGLLLVVCLPVSPAWRGAIATIWMADVCHEVFRMRAFSARTNLVRIDQTGRIVAEGTNGEAELTLLSGSVVLPRLAWLRLRYPDNCRGAELFTGDVGKDPQWQRFQLIWRQAGGALRRSR